MSFYHRWALRTTTLLVVSACFSVVLAAALFSTNLQRMLSLWGEGLQMTVYLAEAANESDRQDLEKILREQKEVIKFEYIDRTKALENFRTNMASYAPTLEQEDELLALIPSSYVLTFDANSLGDRQAGVMARVAQTIKAQAAVEEVSFGQEWIQKYSKFVAAAGWAVTALILTLAMASFLVVANMIGASVSSRKETIAVLELVGASPSMIRRPFVIEGLSLGFCSSVLALAVVGGAFAVAKTYLQNNLGFLSLAEQVEFFSLWSFVLILVLGSALGALASYLSIRSINTGWAASQRVLE